MIHASLFSGIGGPEVAAAMLGWDNAFHCEINPFGKAVLEYWFPNSTSYDDITKTDFKEWRGCIDVLTGGFPCQPFSYAGKRGGRNDDRYLWPEMLRVIDEVRPAWVVGENVAGITTMVEGGVLADMGCDPVMFGEGDGLHRYQLRERFTIERICSDLEGLGYSVQPLLIPAAAVGAPHRRDRVFIVAHDADADGGDAVRGPGVVPRSRGTERLQERDEVREPGVASEIRSTIFDPFANSPRRGYSTYKAGGRTEGDGSDGYVLQRERGLAPQRTDGLSALQRDVANSTGNGWDGCPQQDGEGGQIGADTKRDEKSASDGFGLWGESGIPRKQQTPSNPNGRRSGEIPASVHARLADGDGIIGDGCEWDATHTNGERREEPVIPGRETHPAEDGARIHDRIERPRSYGDAPDSVITGLERENESGNGEEGERVHLRRDATGYRGPGLHPDTRWASFPTVSPVHRGNDGLSFPLDDLTISATKWRTESLKAYGNAIVPQVMYRIFQAIEQCSEKI